MAAERDDRWLDRLLRRRAEAQRGAEASGECLDADTLAAWADHALTANELDAAQVHVSTCPRCLALLAAIERTAPAAPERRPRHAWLGWLVPLTAAATAVAIWVLIPEQQILPVAREARSTSIPLPAPSSSGSLSDLQAPAEAPPASPPAPPAAAQPVSQPALRDEAFLSRDRAKRSEEREERKDARQESAQTAKKEVSLGAAAADRAAAADNDAAQVFAPVPAAPPPPPSAAAAAAPAPQSADALKESVTVTQERSLQKAATIESAAPGGVIRWRVVGLVAVERSTDAGKTWVRTSAPPGLVPGLSLAPSASARSATADKTIVAIRAVDAAHASVTISNGTTLSTFSTADGGVTWTPAQEKPAAPF